MRFKRRRSDRPDSARSRLGLSLEVLESRQLLSRNIYALFPQYVPGDLAVTNPITNKPVPLSVTHQFLNARSVQDSIFSNEGKIVSGTTRAGDQWTITVHGPGYVIVSDTTPNDGVLGDQIATIQLVGTNINTTYVTGNVIPSDRNLTDGTVQFNRLIDTQGVRSVILNGFTLAQTVTPASGSPNNTTTGIFLTGGVRFLHFHDIQAPVDTATNDSPVNVIIGDPSTPLKIEPSIKLDHIFTTVFDSTATTPPANVPVTTPSVNIVINGQTRGIDVFSTTQAVVDTATQPQFPVVGTTGRTSIQTLGIGSLTVHGAATNLTASRDAVPFQNSFSGLNRLRKATFQGRTDAVGLDVHGPIGSLTYAKGMGNATGVFLGQTSTGQDLPATNYGIPSQQVTYAGLGFVAGQVTASRIGKVKIGPSTVNTVGLTNPTNVMLTKLGTASVKPVAGTAMVNSIITTTGNIGKVSIVGDQVNSEIKTGFDYNSFAAGLEGTRAASRIASIKHNGNMLNGVTSATVRPGAQDYGSAATLRGPGRMTGFLTGRIFSTGGQTPLTNVGTGYYARVRKGYLPPPEAGSHNHAGRLVR
jgi:hypothetical protein